MSNLLNFNFLMQINPENIKGMVREENKKETTGLYNYGLSKNMDMILIKFLFFLFFNIKACAMNTVI